MLLNEKVGELTYDGLLADHMPIADVFSVTVAAGEGLLKRGTVLALDDAGVETNSQETNDEAIDDDATDATKSEGGSKFIVLGSETMTANCILAEDIDAAKEDIVALAYRTGHFNESALIVKEGYAFTEKDKEALRDVGILVSDAIAY